MLVKEKMYCTFQASLLAAAMILPRACGDYSYKVTGMSNMFSFASAFNQSLGWCVNDDVDLTSRQDAQQP